MQPIFERCESIRDAIVDAMTEVLSPERQQHIADHVKHCSECQRFTAAIEGDDRMLRDFADQMEANIARVESTVRERIGLGPEESPRADEGVPISSGKTIMTRRIMRLAAAAVFVVAVISVVGYLTGDHSSSEPAFASVLEQVETATSATFRQTVESEDREPFTMDIAIRSDGRTRAVAPNGSVAIKDFSEGVTVQIHPRPKRAIIMQYVRRPKGKGLFNYLDFVQNLHKESGVFVGQKEFDGITTYVYEIERSPYDTQKIWVDARTDLPLRSERVTLPAPDIVSPRLFLNLHDFGGEPAGHSISVGGSGLQRKRKVIEDHFQWNVELDDALFDLTPPAGYRVEQREMDVSFQGENDLTRALEIWVELSGGQYPYDIDDLGDQEKVVPLLVDKYDQDGKPEDELFAALGVGNMLLKGLVFAQQQKMKGQWNYAGDAVQPGDEEAPLYWWMPEGSDSFRVIFGDLHIADLTPEELEKLLRN